MALAAFALRPFDRTKLGKQLAWAMGLVIGIHAIWVLVPQASSAGISRLLTAALAALASVSTLERARMLPWRDRPTWFWAGAGMALWALAHTLETLVRHSNATNTLSGNTSDLVYVSAFLPLLLAFVTTSETQSLRTVFVLNCAQIGLALGLAYVLLYLAPMPPGVAAIAMGKIYGAACALLAVMSLIRGLFWTTQEERLSMRWIGVFLWTYLPVELGMDYLTQYRGLKAGTLLDLLWSVPFALAGWKALTLPVEQTSAKAGTQSSKRVLVESLCPLLLNAGVFALAAATMQQHTILGLSAIFGVLLIQGLQAAVVQMNQVAGRKLLLDREQELRAANAALEQLTLLDPLTEIANRRRFDSDLETAWRRAVRKQHELALLMVDVDFFKGVNDLHGHTYGDECLKALASMMKQQARRPDDLVARIGGEEFVVLLPDTDEVGANAISARLHEAILQMGIVNLASPFDRKLTLSIGYVVCTPRPGSLAPLLVEAADKALYAAKQQGRNRTCWGVVEWPALPD